MQYQKLSFGSGAICVYNYRDLMITNETSQTFQIVVWLDDAFLYGRISCEHALSEYYEVYEKKHWFKRELFGKYSRNNIICRKVFNSNDEQVADEFVTESHALMMYEPYLEAMGQDIGNGDEK